MNNIQENGLLFNQIFLDYLKSVFVQHPTTSYSVIDMCLSMPNFYNDGILVSAGMNILHLNKIIEHNGRDAHNQDIYIVTREAIDAIEKEAEHKRLAAEFGLEIQKRTLDEMKWQRLPRKYWYVIMILSAVLGVVLTRIFPKELPKQSTLSQPTIQVNIDTVVIRKILDGR